MAKSPEEYAHLEWLGYVQPVGLIVSVPAMLEAQCYINKNIIGEHARFLDCLPRDKNDAIVPEITDFANFVHKCLEWEAEDLKEIPQRVLLPEELSSLEVILPQYHETLRPTHVVPVFEPREDESLWQMLIQVLPKGTDFDTPSEADSSRHWRAAPQLKFERLLRETGVAIGLLSNCRQLRLVYAPRGESSGHATFNVHEMVQVAGRPMFAALHMLLSADRMFMLGEKQRLPAILANSRKYQNTVSTKLAEQVLAALYELMRGFQSADDVRKGDLLRDVLANDPNQVYSGLLRILMRLVFVLFAEDRDLMSGDPVYSNNYSITGLFERLREDRGRFPDTMDSRFGAWSQLLTLFRLVFEGGQHGTFKLPARKGYLFDPDRFPFLEGRTGSCPADEPAPVPRISDGVVYRVLRNLLILDGERLSYRTLDVEQIGSVYETVMGFDLEVAAGKSIAIKPVKSHGAPATINLDTLLQIKGEDRAKWLNEQSDQTLGKDAAIQLKDASTIDELLVALDKKIQKKVTPRVVPAGEIVLQPSNERRRSGSHYTPRSLTEPIVRKTLEPILKQLCDPEATCPGVYQPSREDKQRYTPGELQARIRLSEKAVETSKQARELGTPHPSQILDLKICDPAMGSGAFLVETCRQLGDELIKAWYAHDAVPTDIPPDEDEVLYARRQVAQRCLYGVDKNEMAVDLAKLSLWLVTLAKDHPFTFLDHSLRYGDSLVGLTRRQIIGFHWEPKKQRQFGEDLIQKRLDRATEARAKILNAREDVPYRDQEQRLAVANEALEVIRLTGDACVSAFFAGSKKKEREDRCEELFASVSDWYASGHEISKRGPIASAAASLRSGEHPLSPFHWEIEFPEVFGIKDGGFDVFVGNPPFLGGQHLSGATSAEYLDFIKQLTPGTGRVTDLVAYFFRAAFSKLNSTGTIGFVATNSISQGETRAGGLAAIREKGGIIFSAKRRVKWPGEAAVIVSQVFISKNEIPGPYLLDGKPVPKITAFLHYGGGDNDPARLRANIPLSHHGSFIHGAGFTFDDSDEAASTLATMNQLIVQYPDYCSRIHPYLSGEDILTSPTHEPSRYVIDLNQYDEIAATKQFPELMAILKEKVYPERMKLKDNADGKRYKTNWWRWARHSVALDDAKQNLDKLLVHPFTSTHLAFVFAPSSVIVGLPHNVFSIDQHSYFSVLQSRVHELWVRFFASSLEDRLRYVRSDCFETFPFPPQLANNEELDRLGDEYYSKRCQILIALDEGLTATYNRFHDPHEQSSEILHLRELHAAMDRAVLEAYGWDDLAAGAHCKFLLEYEEEDDQESGRKSNKKKPWRLRWPDDFRDEVLARLLELNEQRRQEELLAGKAAEANAKLEGATQRLHKSTNKSQPRLF